jgi:DNA repair exonuclease SbcCD ATPase subunit
MDKYLEAIALEENKLASLREKSSIIRNANNNKKAKIESYKSEEEKLKHEQELNLDRKDFIENKKEYIKKFLIESLKFSMKSSIWFIAVIIIVSLVDYKLGNTLNMAIGDVILGNLMISSLFGSVEYYSVSRYFRDLLVGYKGNIDDDIKLTNSKILKKKKSRTKLEEEVNSNNLLLQELEQAIGELNSNLADLRFKRKALIDSLIEELDSYIKDFEYQESDIHKVLEKKIQ